MSRTYEEIAAERRAKLDPASNEHAQVFEQAYRIAMQVVELRERHGLTQSQLAEQCGMDQADISRIERGSTSPPRESCSASPTRSTQISSSSPAPPESRRRLLTDLLTDGPSEAVIHRHEPTRRSRETPAQTAFSARSTLADMGFRELITRRS